MTRDANIMQWTKEDFLQVPMREDWQAEIECDSLIILPTDQVHDSDFLCMDFVAMKGNEPICRLSGCSDVIHFNGIGGYGKNWYKKNNGIPTHLPPVGWCIDCLPKSGLLRIFASPHNLLAGSALSSFELYAIPKKKK